MSEVSHWGKLGDVGGRRRRLRRTEAREEVRERAAGGKVLREEARFLRIRFWWPKEVARGRGGLWAINFVVKRGMVERKFWETAWEKVELAGLPKARWR